MRKQNHKQKLRAKRRRNRRYEKQYQRYVTTLKNLSNLTVNVNKWIDQMAFISKEISSQWQKHMLHASAYGADMPSSYYAQGGSIKAPNWLAQNYQAAYMPVENSKGPSLVRRHTRDFNQLVVHPDKANSSIVRYHPSQAKATLQNVIMDLNDNCHWSREEIADWLDTLDNQPVFYPNTCPDDCECKDCKPLPKSPSPAIYDTYDAQSKKYSYTKTLFQTQQEPIFSFSVSEDDTATQIQSYYGSYFQKPMYYKGSVTIPNEWKMQLTHEKLLELHQFTQDYGIAYSHDILTNSTTYQMQGTQQQVHKTLAIIQAFMKGKTNELPAQSCTCSINHPGDVSFQGKHCSYHKK